MTDEAEITAEQIERERHLSRIFGSYRDYVKSLPARLWVRTAKGWTSKPR